MTIKPVRQTITEIDDSEAAEIHPDQWLTGSGKSQSDILMASVKLISGDSAVVDLEWAFPDSYGEADWANLYSFRVDEHNPTTSLPPSPYNTNCMFRFQARELRGTNASVRVVIGG